MIIADHLTKYYGPRAAVSDLSFRIERGEVVGLLGRNGAGKTTTLKILSGLLVPTSGRVAIDGLEMREHPERVRAQIGFLPEVPPLYPEMTIEAYLRFAAQLKGARRDLAAKIERALAATDLLEVRYELIGTLSQGFQRRVGIAQAVVHEPALVLLDEPTSSLDPVQVVHMRKLIRGLAARHTVLVSSHLLAEVHQLCDRILVLAQGRLVAEGSEAELGGRVAAGIALELEVRGSAGALAAALGGFAGVRRHEIHDLGGGVVRAGIELATDAREELARALIQAGLGLRRLERVQLELENIFLSLTAADSAAAKAPVRAAS